MAYAIRTSAVLTAIKFKNCSGCFFVFQNCVLRGLEGDTIFVASQYMALNRRIAPSTLNPFTLFYMDGKQGRSRNAACDVCLN